jgi:hypothetical protein
MTRLKSKLPDDRVKLFFSNGRVEFSDYRVEFLF